MSTKLDFIFVIPPFLHDKGVSLGTEYDAKYHYNASIDSTNYKHVSINFNLDKNNSFLVHYSTDYVFSGKNKKPWKENDKTKPINVYGKSKLAGEKFIISSKCKYLILRISWVYADNGENFPKKIDYFLKENKDEGDLHKINGIDGGIYYDFFIGDTDTLNEDIIKESSKIATTKLENRADIDEWIKKSVEIEAEAEKKGVDVEGE